MQPKSVWLVLRGLALVLLLTLFLLRVATPRTHVTPGNALTPSRPSNQAREAAPNPSAGANRRGEPLARPDRLGVD